MDNKALYKITYGLYLLSARENGKDNGCIVNTVMQTANDPTRISAACLKRNFTHDMIKATGRFNVSTLTMDAPFSLFQRFGMQSGRDGDKFSGFSDIKRSENGIYYLTNHANMFLSGKVTESFDLGSHTLFIAELDGGEALSDAPSCTYGYYQSDIKPKPQSVKKKSWVCSVCGYVYEGDTMPDDFECPLCLHGKEDFVLAEK